MLTVTLSINNSLSRLSAHEGENLLSLLLRNQIEISTCSNKSCGKCRVRLLRGKVSGDEVVDGTVRACHASILTDIEIAPLTSQSFTRAIRSATGKNTSSAVLGVVVDVGTTTLVARSYDMTDGSVIFEASEKNPGGAFGADVISRIGAAGDHFLSMRSSLLSSLSQLIVSVCAGVSPVRVIISANTVMQYFLLGKDVTPLGVHPLPTVDNTHKALSPNHLSLDSLCKVLVIPPVSAFVGGDIVSGMLSLDFDRRGDSVLLCDIGTNGELAYLSDGEIKTASAAAGPAFEGGGLECGMAHINGAIDHVWREGNDISFSTVGGGAPVGICGSGVVDAIALLFSSGIIRKDGSFCDKSEMPSSLAPRIRNSRFYICGNVYISKSDINSFMLAKAAIRTAIDLVCGKRYPSVIFLSGAFGSSATIDALVSVGALPKSSRIVPIGNSSLDGGAVALLTNDGIDRANRLAGVSSTVRLAELVEFESAFLGNLNFI